MEGDEYIWVARWLFIWDISDRYNGRDIAIVLSMSVVWISLNVYLEATFFVAFHLRKQSLYIL
jgi:hypothetical protein